MTISVVQSSNSTAVSRCFRTVVVPAAVCGPWRAERVMLFGVRSAQGRFNFEAETLLCC